MADLRPVLSTVTCLFVSVDVGVVGPIAVAVCR